MAQATNPQERRCCPLTCISDGESLVEMHGVGYGIESFKRNDGQCKYAEFAGQHAQEASDQTARRRLPLDSMFLEFSCNEKNGE